MGDNTGVQVKIWLPENLYSIVRELAAAKTQGNVSEMVRQLMSRGLEDDAHQQAVTDALKQVTSSLDHYERLLFFTAQSAGITAVNLEVSAKQQAQKAFPTEPDQAASVAQSTVGKMQKMTHERIRSALREPKPTWEEAD